MPRGCSYGLREWFSGEQDIVLTVISTGVGVLMGDGGGFFSGLTTYDLGGTFTEGLQVIDMNGDSLPDIVTANSGANNISILLHR